MFISISSNWNARQFLFSNVFFNYFSYYSILWESLFDCRTNRNPFNAAKEICCIDIWEPLNQGINNSFLSFFIVHLFEYLNGNLPRKTVTIQWVPTELRSVGKNMFFPLNGSVSSSQFLLLLSSFSSTSLFSSSSFSASCSFE